MSRLPPAQDQIRQQGRQQFKLSSVDDHIPSETDYPHADTPFPQAAFKTLFEGVPADEVAKMTRANAEELSTSHHGP